MKFKTLVFTLFIAITVKANAQQLKTIKHYYGFSGILSEVYTVIKDTGSKHGKYTGYSQGGFVIKKCSYKNNLLHGKYTEFGIGMYKSNANLIREECNYINGKMDGTWSTYTIDNNGKYGISCRYEYDNGEIISETDFYSTGKEKRAYSSNKINEWYENGNKKLQTIDGVTKRWYEDGQKQEEVIDNVIVSYYPNGQILSKGTKSEGEYISYYGNGQINEQGAFAKTEPIGVYKKYYENGDKEIEATYNSDSEVVNSIEYAKNGVIKKSIQNLDEFTVQVIENNPLTGKLQLERITFDNGANSYTVKLHTTLSDGTTNIVNCKANGEKETIYLNKLGKITKSYNFDGSKSNYEYDNKDKLVSMSISKNEGFNGVVAKLATKKFNPESGKLVRLVLDDPAEPNRVIAEYNDNGAIIKLQKGDITHFYSNGGVCTKTFIVPHIYYTLDRSDGYSPEKIFLTIVIEWHGNGEIKSKGYVESRNPDIKHDVWYYFDANGVATHSENKSILSSNRKKRKISRLKMADAEKYLMNKLIKFKLDDKDTSIANILKMKL